MKTAPTIDLATLRRDLESSYRIQAQAMDFLPHGECSWAYRVEAEDGQVYFLKLFREKPLPGWAARLVYRLHIDGQIHQVSYPLPTRSGDLVCELAGFQAAIFPYLDGQSLFECQNRAPVLFRLGQLLAELHSCHTLDQDCLRTEQFDAWGLEEFRQVMSVVTASRPLPGAAGEALCLLQPLQSRLENLLENLLLFQEKARSRPFIPCICHGDPTPGNILVTPGGLPYLIDWDGIILAPRERDLVFWEHDDVFFENESASPVLDGYRSIAGSCDLDPDIIGFYHRQWTVGEIAAFGQRLLFETHSDEQNLSDLENLKEELYWLWN